MNAPGKSTAATKGLTKIRRPTGPLYTIEAVAMMFRRRPRTIYDLLSTRADRFGPAMYEQVHFPRNHRLYRVLSAADVRVLRDLFPIYVKRKVISGQNGSGR